MSLKNTNDPGWREFLEVLYGARQGPHEVSLVVDMQGRSQRVWVERRDGGLLARSTVSSHASDEELVSEQRALPPGVVARRIDGALVAQVWIEPELAARPRAGGAEASESLFSRLAWLANVADRLEWRLNEGSDEH